MCIRDRYQRRVHGESKHKMESQPKMEYRTFPGTGLKVSVLSFGNCFNLEKDNNLNEIVKKAWDLGINFFDTAEYYGKPRGRAEELLAIALKNLNVPREELVISTKIYWGPGSGINNVGLSRKHIIEGALNSLRRLQLDYADIIFCHRYDYDTPLEETVRAFNWLIQNNKTFYWGVSEWTADQIREAHAICERLNLIPPAIEQPQYSLFVRDNVEKTLAGFFAAGKLGTTIWSPLAGGVITGKYRNGIPEESRIGADPETQRFYQLYLGPGNLEKTNQILDGLEAIAKELGYSLPIFAIAWTIVNKDVTTAILGASRPQQLEENIKALDLLRKWTPEIEKRVDAILGNAPANVLDPKNWQPKESRRFHHLRAHGSKSVSYTHLTLPTIYSV
eukprot:TRINITY_DN785_c0_g1_i2.p1 TRINITY_DN785_c0_g1~~TRINITY_DN785_c0_g1_i2.p1  ORF type:complete len:407 (-),score=145.77 TRINITY_DN785_c0_g1_i2:5-1177(-)